MRNSSRTFLVRIEAENRAFDGEAGPELARILRDIANRVEGSSDGDLFTFKNVLDTNGNIVGQFALKPAGYES